VTRPLDRVRGWVTVQDAAPPTQRAARTCRHGNGAAVHVDLLLGLLKIPLWDCPETCEACRTAQATAEMQTAVARGDPMDELTHG